MKKILSYFLILCTTFSLCACSSSVEKSDVITVINAFNKTLKADSASISGTFQTNEDKMNIKLDIIQNGNLQVAFNMGLEAGGNTADDFLSFYIKDEKTYLSSMGVTSQSVLKNIGIDSTKKLSTYNPFLDFTDDEIVSFFTSSKKKNDTITLEMNDKSLATLLDAFGTISISKGTIEAIIKNDVLSSLKITIKGYQAMEEASSDVDIVIDVKIENVNGLKEIKFPSDLENF
ncbi:MAG: hypothetical protein HUJ53_07045 [Holdemanella sp.]|nr:hypothetical protein [Holdemanella sp.]